MAPRNQNQRQQPSEAEALVGEALDLDLTNLDGNQGDDEGDEGDEGDDSVRRVEGDQGGAGDQEGDELPEGDDDGQGGSEQQLDDLSRRVTHTEGHLPRRAEVKPDKKGNLVNAKGEIVAKRGAEARFYQKADRATRELDRFRREVEPQVSTLRTNLTRAVEIGQELHTALEAAKARDQQVTALGLNATEQLEALQLAAEGKTNPLSAIRKLLTRAAARGINLQELEVGKGTEGIKAILDLVKEEMAKGLNPLKEFTAAENTRKTTEQEQEANKARVTKEVTTFFNAEPKAKFFFPVFAKIMGDPRNAHLSLSHIWDKIQLNLLQNNQTVDGLIRKQSQRPNADRRANGGGSLPRGRGQPHGGMENREQMAPPTDSYDDILKGVFKDTGYGRQDEA